LTGGDNLIDRAAEDHRRRQHGDPAVVVLGVVPVEEAREVLATLVDRRE
jgi:hypothetical protein